MPLNVTNYATGMKSEKFVVDSIRKEYPQLNVIAGIDIPDERREAEWEKVYGYHIDAIIEGKGIDVKTFSRQHKGVFISKYMLENKRNRMPDYIIICNNLNGPLTTKSLDVVPWKVVFDYCWQTVASRNWYKLPRNDGTFSEGIYFQNVFESNFQHNKKNYEGFGIKAAMSFSEFVRKVLNK